MTDTAIESAPTGTLGTHPVTGFRTELAQHVPLTLLQPSPYNPRKRFSRESLAQLADSIEAKGVQQAIVARPLADAKRGAAQYEIVAGERRWRASKILEERGVFIGPATIPTFIRELDDFEAREIALLENTDRDNLHPLEQAQGYEDLLMRPVGGGEFKPKRLRGYTVEELARRIRHEPNFVFGRLKLLQLIPAAREAFLDDKLQLKIAETLARLPAAEQERALPQLLSGWGGEPYSHRQAVAFMRDNFGLKLGKAPFPIADADLVAAAGACSACPKRSSANPGLFGDDSTGDLCLDGKCYKAKSEAHFARQVETAQAEGATIAPPKLAAKILGGYSRIVDHVVEANGYAQLDKPIESLTGTKKILRTLLGDDKLAVTIVQLDGDEAPVRLVKLADARVALAAKGLLATKSKSGVKGAAPKKLTAEDIRQQRKRRMETLLCERMPSALWAHLGSDGSEGLPQGKAWLRALANRLSDTYYGDSAPIIRLATGKPLTAGDWMAELEAETVAKLCVTLLLCDVVESEGYGRPVNHTEENNELAAEVGFDLKALREAVGEEVDGAIRDEIAELVKQVDTDKIKRKPTTKAASKAQAKPKAKPKAKAAAKAEAEPLTPETALAEAVAADAAPVKAAAKVKKAAPYLSPDAAWPFPGRPSSGSPAAQLNEAPPQSATVEKPAKVRKAKASAKAEPASV